MPTEILHVTLNPLKNDTRVLFELKKLLEAGLMVAIVAPAGDQPISDLSVYPFERKNGRGPWQMMVAVLRAARLFRAITQDLPGIKIIHCHDLLALLAVVIGRHRSSTRNLKIIYDSHELAWDTYNLQGRPVRKILFSLVETFLIRRIDAFITVSKRIRDEYVERYNMEQPTHVLLNNFHEPLNPPRTRICTKLAPKLVYVGGFERGKGLNKIINLPNNTLRELDLTFIGSGPMEGVLRTLAAELSNIKIKGYMKPEALISELTQYDLGILPLVDSSFGASKMLAMPNKMFEYTAAGLGLICWKSEVHSKVISQFSLGYAPLTEESFEAFMSRISGSDKLDFHIEANAFRKQFSALKNERDFLDFYRRIFFN